MMEARKYCCHDPRCPTSGPPYKRSTSPAERLEQTLAEATCTCKGGPKFYFCPICKAHVAGVCCQDSINQPAERPEQTAHTPLPWRYQEVSDAYTHIIRGPNNEFLCSGPQDSSGETEAIMRFIVTACNNYEALKLSHAALWNALRDFQECASCGHSRITHCNQISDRWECAACTCKRFIDPKPELDVATEALTNAKKITEGL